MLKVNLVMEAVFHFLWKGPIPPSRPSMIRRPYRRNEWCTRNRPSIQTSRVEGRILLPTPHPHFNDPWPLKLWLESCLLCVLPHLGVPDSLCVGGGCLLLHQH